MLAGGHEIANVEAHVDELAGGPHAEPFDLGALATAWPRVRAARSVTRYAPRSRVAVGRPRDQRAGCVRGLVASQVGAPDRAMASRSCAGGRPPPRRSSLPVSGSVTVGAEPPRGDRRLAAPGSGLGGHDPRVLCGGSACRRPVGVRRRDRRAWLWQAETAWWRGLGDEAARQVRRASTGEAAVAMVGGAAARGRAAVCGGVGGCRVGAGRAWRRSMPWPEVPGPIPMRRVAVVAPTRRWRDVLVAVADSGIVEPEEASPVRVGWRARRTSRRARARRSSPPTGPTSNVACGRSRRSARRRSGAGACEHAALQRDQITALAGWAPADAIGQLDDRLAPLGGSVVELPLPPGSTSRRRCAHRRSSGALRPLVDTYATVPYRDVDPVWFATVAYVVMFGMMFGDVGDGLLLVVGALLLRRSRSPRFARRPPGVAAGPRARRDGRGVRSALRGGVRSDRARPDAVARSPRRAERCCWPASASARCCWRAPTRIGIVNRWREGGPARRSGRRAGSPAPRCSSVSRSSWVASAWSRTAAVGRRPRDRRRGSRAGRGRAAEPGRPGGAGVCRRVSSRSTSSIRLGSNVVSFARLAAFGLMHAAIGAVVWDATTALGVRPGAAVAADRGLRRRSRRGLRPGGARGRGAGAATRVLRAVLPDLRRRGPPVPAVARPARSRGDTC